MSAVFIMVAKTISTTQCNYWEEYGQAGFTRMAGWMRWWYTREWSFTSVLTWLDVEQIRWHLLALNSNYSWMMAGFFCCCLMFAVFPRRDLVCSYVQEQPDRLYRSHHEGTGGILCYQFQCLLVLYKTKTNKNLYSAKFVDKTRQRRWVVS